MGEILIGLLINIAFWGGLIWLVVHLFKNYKKKRAAEKEQLQQLMDASQRAYNERRAIEQAAINKYGQPAHEAFLNDGYVADFPAARKVLLKLDVYDFDEIKRVYTDSEVLMEATPDKVKQTTTHNLGSTLGRAAVGALVVGPVGAVIGGVTGATTTTENVTEQGMPEFREYHVYVTTTKGEVQIDVYDEKDYNLVLRILDNVING